MMVCQQPKIKYTYSVLQSDANSFCDDVVLDSVNMASRDEIEIFTDKTFSGVFYDFSFGTGSKSQACPLSIVHLCILYL